ncbi:leucine-rich repeat-containing protein 20-like isoform X1 [Drosophila pseudoobscura]|uniref:Leucine-rich repeat-containing protein 20-like isoform X1 n=1 Tax=Drosophila pseudoobscura pseudoobscura TaxID=46245 RepID=A0A6I8UGE0_DROPS|nr:leucine-rich repeat-containing protein 20 isoform X1 [Drosophila pseudoobscura]
MRPFGNDITNFGSNNSGGNGGANGGNRGNNNGASNGRGANNATNNETNNEGTSEGTPDATTRGGEDHNVSDEITPTDSSNESSNESIEDPRLPAHIARIGGIATCSPIAGRGIIRVVHRCEDAKENEHLDLSECQLMTLPDAVYHLMRNTVLKSCDLSGNDLKSITPKFTQKFSAITDLNLSSNNLSRLPDELANMTALAKLNISRNSFIVLPQVIFKLESLTHLDAQENKIYEIDTDEAIVSNTLVVVDLRNNPLGSLCRRKLQNLETSFRLEISNDDEDDW